MQRNYRITVNGQPYDVLVEELDSPERTAAVHSAPVSHVSSQQAPTPPPASSQASGVSGAPAAAPGDVTVPMGGVLVSVDVTVGQSVKSGDRVATLEAMKMKSPVVVRQDGKIAKIHIAAGSAVIAGQAIMSLSAD